MNSISESCHNSKVRVEYHAVYFVGNQRVVWYLSTRELEVSFDVEKFLASRNIQYSIGEKNGQLIIYPIVFKLIISGALC